MAARKKTIKKPKFIIIYSISFLIVLAVFTCVGAIVYHGESSEYYARVEANARDNYSSLEDEINAFLEKDREEISRADIVSLKWSLITHYTMTGQYIEVRYGNEIVADAKCTIMLDYSASVGDGSGLSNNYTLEITDKKYMERFRDPKLLELRKNDGENNISLYQGIEGFRTRSYLGFVCNEFYADLENRRFIPVECTFILPDVNGQLNEIVVNISPSPDDINGYTLISIDDSNDTAYAWMEGLGGPLNVEFDTGIPLGNDKEDGIYQTLFSIKRFEETYAKNICIGALILVLSTLLIALIPATIRYNINKRNYDIYEFRLQTTNAMAHDLKTPLASIIAYAEILNNNIDADNREHYLTKISDTASKMNSIVNSILQFSRSENAEVPVNKSEVSAPELIAAVINENEQQINEKGLTTDFDSSEELKLNTDKELMHQALGNLINNAAKYAKEGTIVRIKYDEEMISITNETAEPIEDIANIKDPFIKGNSSRQNGGTGLGLAIANNDLVMLGYKLDIRCEGDVFTATIKLRK